MSYQKLNQFTRPFAFPIPRCNDSVQDINTEESYFISLEIDSGYWKVVAEEEAQERLEFSTPDGNQGCKVMHIGALNPAPKFVAMTMKLQLEWYILAKERGL